MGGTTTSSTSRTNPAMDRFFQRLGYYRQQPAPPPPPPQTPAFNYQPIQAAQPTFPMASIAPHYMPPSAMSGPAPMPMTSAQKWQGMADGGAVEEALRLARGEVLSDRFPSQYLPEVGRQVMADGGEAKATKESDGTIQKALEFVSSLFGRAPSARTVDPERRAPSWTSPEELATAKKYDLSYGDPSAGFFQPGAMVRMPSNFVEMSRAFNEDRVESLPRRPIDQQMADRLQGAWLASQSSPIAALGFDPRAMITAPQSMTEGKSLTIGGAYAPDADYIFTTGQNDSTYAHEAVHRGLQKLREAGRLPKDFSNTPEEVITRAIMKRNYGDVERGRGEIGDRQVRSGEALLKVPQAVRMLDEAEAAAAKLLAEQRPRGPR